MNTSKERGGQSLSKSQAARIEAEVKQAAIEHLKARDAATALSHFTEDVIAVSNDVLFPTYEALAADVKAYYDMVQVVHLVAWDEMYIRIISTEAVIVTARFRYSFTDVKSEKTDLRGVWTAFYVRQKGGWKIRVRHESFTSLDQ